MSNGSGVPIDDDVAKRLFPSYPDPAQITEFYTILGHAISAWQVVEMGLYETFERATAPGNPGAAGCAFHALQHTASKLSAADAAVRFALLRVDDAVRPELINEWERIHKKVNVLLTRRNHFAHFQVMTYFNEDARVDRIHLEPLIYDFRYAAGLKKRVEYRLSDIQNIAQAFMRVYQRLHLFLQHIPQPKKKS